jgi:predicted amidohydrolase
MPRLLKVAAAQVGAIHRTSTRSDTLQRLINLLDDAITQGVKLVVFPETTFTTFFPRYVFETQKDLDQFFEREGNDVATSENVKPLFDRAREGKVDICVGYAERTDDGRGFNTCVYYSGVLGKVIGKYRKVHLPGTVDPFLDPRAINQLEKRYFLPGDLGFKAFRVPGLVNDALKQGTKETITVGKGDPVVGMMICNDRRWPEAWRVYGLQGVELVLCGFNTNCWPEDEEKPAQTMGESEAEALFHHRLCMEANSYMNSCFSISAARAGKDDGKYGLIGGSGIVSPQGHTIVQAKGTGDELVVAEIDLEECRPGKEKVS